MEKNLSHTEVEAALSGLSGADSKRISFMAREYARGLIHLAPNDLIMDAYTALFGGDRVFPRHAKPVNVVINAMRSEASNCRDREKKGAIDHHVDLASLSQPLDEDDDGGLAVIPTTDVTPERIVASRQLILIISTLVADDQELQVLISVQN